MQSCVVYGCTNNSLSEPSIGYYPFPKTSSVSQQWIEACGWKNCSIDITRAHICSIHFEDSAYNKDIKIVDSTVCYTKTLKDYAVPTLYLPQGQIIIKAQQVDVSNVKGLVLYTINQPNQNETIATISVQNDNVEKQLLELQSPSSIIKLETDVAIKCESVQQNEKDLVENYRGLKGKINSLKQELEIAKVVLHEKEEEFMQINGEYNEVQDKMTNKKIFSDDDQIVILSKVFSKAQIKILFGKKKIYWSNDDMAVGYTVRHLSNKRCYIYLTKTLKIPLPAISSIKRWVTTKKAKIDKSKKKRN